MTVIAAPGISRQVAEFETISRLIAALLNEGYVKAKLTSQSTHTGNANGALLHKAEPNNGTVDRILIALLAADTVQRAWKTTTPSIPPISRCLFMCTDIMDALKMPTVRREMLPWRLLSSCFVAATKHIGGKSCSNYKTRQPTKVPTLFLSKPEAVR
jgi:hypothetical protein